MKYFSPIPETLEELKKKYRKLALKNHPDAGGSDEEMKSINNEYTLLFKRLKNTHKNKDGNIYTSNKETNETPEEFINIINILIRFDGITIEIIGCFIWVLGNTKPYKENLKELGFKWHSSKFCWYLSPANYKKRNRIKYELEELRSIYGSQEVKTKPYTKVEVLL